MMRTFLGLGVALAALPLAGLAQQQGAPLVTVQPRDAVVQGVWVQVEAQPTLAQAEARARAYASRLPQVAGYAMDTGWYAIVLGPFAPEDAAERLAFLRGQGVIPADSYVTDGARFGQRYWPAGAFPDALAVAPPDTALPGTAAAPLPADPAPADPLAADPFAAEETPAEARAAEAALDAEARRALQEALQWEGHYLGAIDGAFGPGTRASMAEWQGERGLDTTGVLTTRQRETLLAEVAAARVALGLATVTEEEAGISVTLPMALVEFAGYEPPFVQYAPKDGSGVRVMLISRRGDAATLATLYDLLQGLEAMPLEGERSLTRSDFRISGRDARHRSHAEAELSGGSIKGFVLVWPAGDADRMDRVLAAMQGSFRATSDRTLDAGLGLPSAVAPDLLMQGLDTRKPLRARSGFYVDGRGTVATTTEAVEACGRITLDGGIEARVRLTDASGLALLDPAMPLAPPAHAAFASTPPRPGSEAAVAGFAYAEVLDAPVMTYGAVAELTGLGGETDLMRLSLPALPGDAGGAILDASGAVTGMLLPRAEGPRVLPEEVAHALQAGPLVTRLAEAGLAPEPAVPGPSLPAADLTARGVKMAVRVLCWE
ncbi:serine protease [Frigidibacter oleivorans]|uniref:serine protease n=1 Tax=Frigidibacter oleivorans TaxID=2487129 RepID=UPI0013DF9D89|nr:serine protease [Frigidibacter oleivorans]